MIWLFLLFVLLLIVFSIKLEKNDNYCSKDQCNVVKGVFILLVFFSHACQYIIKNGYDFHLWGDSIVPVYKSFMGQLIVTMFLFYSGYGIAESITRKGKTYVNQMLAKRIFPVWINFCIAVFAFAIMNLILSINMEWKQFFLSLICWKSIGNSNWYIFIILLCYINAYVAFKLLYHCKYSEVANRIGGFIVFIMCLIGMIILSYYKQSYWYDTILCFPAGMLFSSYKEKIEPFISKNYYLFLIVLLLSFILLKNTNLYLHGFVKNIEAVVFSMIIVLMTMKIKIDSPALNWCGKNLFPFYIYQRIPMIILAKYMSGGILFDYPLLFMVITLILSLVIILLYPKWEYKHIKNLHYK